MNFQRCLRSEIVMTMFPEFRPRVFGRKRTGNALTAKSAGVMCLLALTAIFAKTALAQGYTGAVYAGTDDGQKNGLVAYGRKADGTLAYIGVYLSGGAGGDSTLVARSTR